MKIDIGKLIYPVFVKKGINLREEMPLMPGVSTMSPDVLTEEIYELGPLGIKNILVFGVPEKKSWYGEEAFSAENAVNEAVRSLKKKMPDITVYTDVCLCAYVSHGHCGIVPEGYDKLDNVRTVEALAKTALSHAEAGADYVAPSAMAEGQVKGVRSLLDTRGFKSVKIMGYSAKFASGAYGPFRDIADSAPVFGDRSAYQLDFSGAEEALKKISEDIDAGADMVMVKPAMWYLDIVSRAKALYDKPLAVYNVSGEYSAIKKGAACGLWDEKKIVYEIFSSFRRAGADYVISYYAKDIALWREHDN